MDTTAQVARARPCNSCFGFCHLGTTFDHSQSANLVMIAPRSSCRCRHLCINRYWVPPHRNWVFDVVENRCGLFTWTQCLGGLSVRSYFERHCDVQSRQRPVPIMVGQDYPNCLVTPDMYCVKIWFIEMNMAAAMDFLFLSGIPYSGLISLSHKIGTTN